MLINIKRFPVSIFFLSVYLFFGFPALQSNSQNLKEPVKKIFIMEIRDEIDPSMSRYVGLALNEAAKIHADIVVVDMNTYGGGLIEADSIRKRFLDFKKPVYVFINKNAASAGALISIACDSIYMEPGSSIGASTAVDGSGTPASEKVQSYTRSLMRSTAQATGRDPRIAEAMVGISKMDDDTLYKAGSVLTFSTEEAIKNHFCEAKVNSIDEIMKRNNITSYEKIYYKISFIEKAIAFFLNPFIRAILILIILGGIYFELQAPGLGLPIIAAISAALLYFIPSYMNGLAQYWEILLFIIGIVLLALEIFVIPGFGVAGISGILLCFASLVLVMVNNDFFDFSMVSGESLMQAFTIALIGITGSLLLLMFGASKMVDSKYFRKITLQTKLDHKHGYTSNFNKESTTGKTGIAHTILRPSGKVLIGETIYDAYTGGDYVERGSEIVVVDDSATSLKVKKKV
jgi:membrane-bound serine protease (ClpP class)